MTTPHAIADQIESAWGSWLTGSRRPVQSRQHVYASAWRVCDRRMVLDATKPGDLPPWPAETLAKFRRGDDRERDLLQDLRRIGRDAEPSFRVFGDQERFELKDRRGRVAIVGKVDARLELDGLTYRPPLEVKSWSPFVVDKLESFGDVFENPWTSSGGYQLLSYLYGAAEPFGFLLLDRSGIPRLLPVELDQHWDRVEAFLTKAEAVVDHIRAGTLPDYIDDPGECHRCPFYGSTCNPPETMPGATVLTDPELEAALVRREALAAAAHEYDALDADVKKALRGVEHGFAGPFQIRGMWGKSSRVELPPELKKQFTVTNDRGRFTLEITRV